MHMKMGLKNLLLTTSFVLSIVFNNNDVFASGPTEEGTSLNVKKRLRIDRQSEDTSEDSDESLTPNKKKCLEVIQEEDYASDESSSQMAVDEQVEDFEELDFTMLVDSAVEMWDEKVEEFTLLSRTILEKVILLKLTEVSLEAQVEKLHEELEKPYVSLSWTFYNISQNQTLDDQQRKHFRKLGAFSYGKYLEKLSTQELNEEQRALFEKILELNKTFSVAEQVKRLHEESGKGYGTLSLALYRLSQNQTVDEIQKEHLQKLGAFFRKKYEDELSTQELSEEQRALFEKILALDETLSVAEKVKRLHEESGKSYGTLSSVLYRISWNQTVDELQKKQLQKLGAFAKKRYEDEKRPQKKLLSPEQAKIMQLFSTLPADRENWIEYLQINTQKVVEELFEILSEMTTCVDVEHRNRFALNFVLKRIKSSLLQKKEVFSGSEEALLTSLAKIPPAMPTDLQKVLWLRDNLKTSLQLEEHPSFDVLRTIFEKTKESADNDQYNGLTEIEKPLAWLIDLRTPITITAEQGIIKQTVIDMRENLLNASWGAYETLSSQTQKTYAELYGIVMQLWLTLQLEAEDKIFWRDIATTLFQKHQSVQRYSLSLKSVIAVKNVNNVWNTLPLASIFYHPVDRLNVMRTQTGLGDEAIKKYLTEFENGVAKEAYKGLLRLIRSDFRPTLTRLLKK